MKYFVIASRLLIALFCVYLFGVLIATLANAFGFYENYSVAAVELGLLFRLILLLVLAFVAWRYSWDIYSAAFCAVFSEAILLVLASVGYVFSSTEFFIGTPIGLVLQDFFSYLGVGFLVVRFGLNCQVNSWFLGNRNNCEWENRGQATKT